MAGISTNKNGTRILTYYDKNDKQQFIRLGRIPKQAADQFKVYFERLVAAQKLNVSLDSETVSWLSNLSDIYYDKLMAKGLVAPRKKSKTLIEIIPGFIKARAAGVQEATVEIWKQSERSLYLYFGEERNVESITPNDAEAFKSWLVTSGRLDGKGGLKPTTAWKRLQHVVSFFAMMVKNDEISKNPFIGVGIQPVVDEDRNVYVEEKFIYQVMDVLPDAEWRLIVALWRFGGLRGSSEPLLLKWSDILWDQNKIIVHARKTKRYEGKARRTIPIFPELVEPLREAFEQAAEGDVYVVTKHAPRYLRNAKDRSVLPKIKANLGTVFGGYVRRAGLTPRSKIVNNMRASAESDLLNGKYGKIGVQTIAAWLGHSPRVMLKHYGRVRDEDYRQVAKSIPKKKKAKMALPKEDGITLNLDVSELKSLLEAPLYAPLQDAEWGGNELQGAATPFQVLLAQVVQEYANRCKKEKREASSGSPPNCPSGENRTPIELFLQGIWEMEVSIQSLILSL